MVLPFFLNKSQNINQSIKYFSYNSYLFDLKSLNSWKNVSFDIKNNSFRC